MKRLIRSSLVLCSGLLLLFAAPLTVHAVDKSTPMLLEKNATANKASPKLMNPQVQGSQWGAQPGAAQGAGQSRRRGDVVVEDIRVTRELEKSTPKIQEKVMPGKAAPPIMHQPKSLPAVQGSKSEPKSSGIVTPSSSQGGGAGKADLRDFSMTKSVDKATPRLQEHAAPSRDKATDLPAMQHKASGFVGPGSHPPPDDQSPLSDDGAHGIVTPSHSQGQLQPGDKGWDPSESANPMENQKGFVQ